MGSQLVEATRSYLRGTVSGLVVYTELTLPPAPAGRVTPPLPACPSSHPLFMIPASHSSVVGLQVVLPGPGHLLLFPKSGISCLREKQRLPVQVRGSRCWSGNLGLLVLKWEKSLTE